MRVLRPRNCAICGHLGGTIALTYPLKWLRASNPERVKFPGDYAHLHCIQANHPRLKVSK